MVIAKSDIIYPCPFSKAYGIPTTQAWKLLKFFLLYRVLLSSGLLAVQQFHFDLVPFNLLDAHLFQRTCEGYFIVTLLSGISIFTKRIPYPPQAQLLIFTDIIAIVLLMHACGGIYSGIGTLLVISIAFGGILIGGHCAMLFAALASLAVLTEQTLAVHIHKLNYNTYTEAGLLGAAFFTTALLAYILAQRSEQSQLIAQQHKQTILKLEDLNRSIIQHLQAGIIITNQHQIILMTNQMALHLLNMHHTPSHLQAISSTLTTAFQHWLSNVDNNLTTINSSDQNQIHCRFSFLPTHAEMLFMITLEDVALYNQRLQQSKLASLGHLTASIAHEIRNPLGAISHATQLLAESPGLPAQDQRLTDIIQTHSQRINGIIEEILQLSRRKTSQRQRIAINAWLMDYVGHFIQFQYLQPGQVHLNLSPQNPQALIDADHLKQILDNLCQNALKHNHANEPYLIITTEQTPQGVNINITDNGEKISPEIQEHLFEPFYTTSNTGTGLGLYISKELAELNQAKLTYLQDSKSHIQAQFNCFRLCLVDAEQPNLEL